MRLNTFSAVLFAALAVLTCAVAVQSPSAVRVGSSWDQHLQENSYRVAKEGFYIKVFNGTVPQKDADKFAKIIKAHLPITFVNPSNQSMCLQASYANLLLTPEEWKVDIFSYNSTLFQRIPIKANTTMQIGNFVPRGDRVGYNGRVQAYFGCNSNCTQCPGEKKIRHTLFEWKYGNETTDPSNRESFWNNLSNVDGLTSNINYTVYDLESQPCRSRSCNVTLGAMKQTCPKDRFWEVDGAHGCASDCNATGEPRYCCTGEYSSRNEGVCPLSSRYLKQLCPDAYASPYDDQTSLSVCPKTSAARIEFSPIV
ncbi:hypothetical protein LZ554_004098 [Drepanopeziza brunnea f. sp. 'monogermtubi']|nr:hypothetical protein LZ554_004098 [Drepanopeziza brunnea f. sp. 'monogermtubi']